MLEDVPSPIDYRLMSEAREWEANAMEKRPWRTEIFERFVSEIAWRHGIASDAHDGCIGFRLVLASRKAAA